MNGLMILVLIVVGVVGAYLLEERLGKSNTGNWFDFGGVSNKKISEHFSKPFPQGFYTNYDESITSIISLFFFALTVFMVLIATNFPSLFNTGLIYSVMGLIVAIVSIAEFISPKKTISTALASVCGYNTNIKFLITIGLIIGAVFIPLNYYFTVMTIGGVVSSELLFSFFFYVIAVPWIEEGLFTATFGASLVERLGVFMGLVFIVVFWIGFHSLAWNPLTLTDVLFLGSYRTVIVFTLVKYKSSTPAWISHALINGAAFLLWS